IVMGNWIPGDPTLVAQVLRISAAYSPPPPDGFISPVTWGVEANVVERFGDAGIPADRIAWEPAPYSFITPGSPVELIATFRIDFGPTMNAFAAATADGREAELQSELEVLFNECNANGSSAPTSIPATYLRVTISV